MRNRREQKGREEHVKQEVMVWVCACMSECDFDSVVCLWDDVLKFHSQCCETAVPPLLSISLL